MIISIPHPNKVALLGAYLLDTVKTVTIAVAAGAFCAGPSVALAQGVTGSDATRIRYKTVMVDGIRIFYREAGDPSKPTVLMLHGFPSSSHMFRDLMPLLTQRFHVVAPDYPGSGFSEAPGEEKFKPTFANLAQVMNGFVQSVGLRKFIIYMHDFGGPVGFRMASAHPAMVSGLIIQNANAYEEGIAPAILNDMKTRAAGPLNAEGRQALDSMLSTEGTKFQYLTGARNPSGMDPTGYSIDAWVQAMPAQHRIQQALVVDYYDNVLQYPTWHRYLKEHQPKTLVVWGRNDPIFLEAGAHAYRTALPKAEVHFFNTGHFALEEDAVGIAQRINRFYRD